MIGVAIGLVLVIFGFAFTLISRYLDAEEMSSNQKFFLWAGLILVILGLIFLLPSFISPLG
jgi:uncharacterized protein YjeT (DUF2065 family)